MSQYVKIVSDGTDMGTSVYVGDTLIDGVTAVRIDPIEIGQIVRATIELTYVELDLLMPLKDDKKKGGA